MSIMSLIEKMKKRKMQVGRMLQLLDVNSLCVGDVELYHTLRLEVIGKPVIRRHDTTMELYDTWNNIVKDDRPILEKMEQDLVKFFEELHKTDSLSAHQSKSSFFKYILGRMRI